MVLSACKKEENIHFKGIIYDNIKAAIEGVEVGIYAKKVNNGIYSDNYSKIASTVTQSDGSYEFDFKWIPSDDFIIKLSKNNYYTQENAMNTSQMIKGNTITENYTIIPKGYAKIKVQNKYGNPTAEIKVWTNNTIQSEVDCCPDYAHLMTASGYPYETEWTCHCAANNEFQLNWVVNTTTPVSTQAYNTSQYIKTGETYNFVITY